MLEHCIRVVEEYSAPRFRVGRGMSKGSRLMHGAATRKPHHLIGLNSNSDGLYRANSDGVTCGGVFCDEHGVWIVEFSKTYRFMVSSGS
ncbi:hypothetical protein V6N13_057902 [Hibiscus sabdariffa]|uniref:Uncharacterized protein n=1 Tax=Hibiscus sabdariffa TaxID=183260 RepID=A0ABR2GHS0_9ROSI